MSKEGAEQKPPPEQGPKPAPFQALSKALVAKLSLLKVPLGVTLSATFEKYLVLSSTCCL